MRGGPIRGPRGAARRGLLPLQPLPPHDGHVAAYAACARADLVLTEDRGLHWYPDGDRERGFCDACGASLFWRAAGRETVSVAAGSIDPPSGLRTVGQIFVASAGDYYAVRDEDGEPFPEGLPPGRHAL